MKKFGIDISRWQGDFDFAKAKKEHGVEFAILKIGGGDDGLYKDKQFENSYAKCEECGLDKGAYFFGHAMNMEEAEKEAAYFIELLQGKRFEYPVFYDVEADMLSLDKETLTNICLYVLQTVQNAGFWVGIYASQSPFNVKMYDERLKGFSHWVAKYSTEKPIMTSGAAVQMWQFGGEKNFIQSNKINGQTVDQNYCYIDYPELIKAKKLNGWGDEKPETKPEAKPEKVETKYKIGDHVSFDKIYEASTSREALKPSITSGTITDIKEGAAHPYLINENTGWIDDSCIVNK